MSQNGISHLSTKQARQVAKLDLAQTKRTASGNGHRARHTYDINQLPTKYSGNNIVDNANPSGLQQGRPWY
jgi:hypothetical protein